jgi:hypothetical protein
MEFKTWVYDCKGTRYSVYSGKSENTARANAFIASDVIALFSLDAVIRVVERNSMGLEKRELLRRDYYNGRAWIIKKEKDRHDITLALDKRVKA